jgi:aromatic-amino-acid transaminase
MSSALAEAATLSLFDALPVERGDALLALIGMHARDPRQQKIDLGVGVFRDDQGCTPVLQAVKLAEQQLLEDETTKSYLGAEGDVRFAELLSPIILGSGGTDGGRICSVQTPGGTGALRLALELVAQSRPSATVWVGAPTWANHLPLVRAAGLSPRAHPFFDIASGIIDFAAAMAALGTVRPGDVVLLHGCCHNPTGADLSLDQWHIIGSLLERRGAVPLVDLAYQGLGDGLNEDAAGTRHIFSSFPEAIIAYSCDKNFGLYRERVGGLWVKARSEASAQLAFAKMLSLARVLWSMPPSHGAAIVRVILDDVRLRQIWATELSEMRTRLAGIRTSLAATHPRLTPLAEQKGMFATLPIGPDGALILRERNAIYMTDSGRINIAGLRDETIPVFAEAIRPYLDERMEQ